MTQMIELQLGVYYETERAVLLGPTREEADWVGKSMLEQRPKLMEVGTVVMPEWLARKKGWT